MDFSIDSVIPCWYTRCASEVGRRLCTSPLQEEVMKSVWMVAGRMLSTLQWITPELGVWGGPGQHPAHCQHRAWDVPSLSH